MNTEPKEKRDKKNTSMGTIALLISALMYSMSGWITVVMSRTFTAYGQVFVRSAAVVLVAGIFFIYKKNKPSLKGIDPLPLIFIFIFRPVGNIAFAYSILTINATNTIFYVYAAQLAAGFIIGTTLLKERTTWTNWTALLLAAIALYVFAIGKDATELGIWFGLLCGLSEAIKNSAYAKIKND